MKIIIDRRSGKSEVHIWEVVDSNDLICGKIEKSLLKFDKSINEWVDSEIGQMTVDELIKELEKGGIIAVYAGSLPNYIISDYVDITITHTINIE